MPSRPEAEPRARPRRIVLLELPANNGTIARVYLKGYRETPLSALRRLLVRSRARQEAAGLRELAEAVANPIHVLGWGELRVFGVCIRSCIALEEWPESFDLREFARRVPVRERSPAAHEHLVRAVTALMLRLRRLHDRGCLLRDSYEKNILYRPGLESGSALAWIDQPRLRRARRAVSTRGRAYDLACLDKGARNGLLRARERLEAARTYLRGDATSGGALEVDERAFLHMILRERMRRENQTFLSRHFRSKTARRWLQQIAHLGRPRAPSAARTGAETEWEERESRG